MARQPVTPCGGRLRDRLTDLGMPTGTTREIDLVTAAVNRRSRSGQLKPDALRAVLQRGRELNAGELLMICSGLGITADEILYDDPPAIDGRTRLAKAIKAGADQPRHSGGRELLEQLNRIMAAKRG